MKSPWQWGLLACALALGCDDADRRDPGYSAGLGGDDETAIPTSTRGDDGSGGDGTSTATTGPGEGSSGGSDDSGDNSADTGTPGSGSGGDPNGPPTGPDCDAPPAGILPAFPCAEGFGAVATGGRGGDVFHVTSLADHGAGTLREGIDSAAGPRTIVFEVGGEIRLTSSLVIDNAGLTIAGQTAPGDGITIRDRSVDIRNASDIVIRFLRIRRGSADILAGSTPTGSGGLDTVSIDDSRNIIFDHVSLSWSCDEVFGIVQNENVTLQWLIVSEPLGGDGLHPYGENHAYGLNDSATTLSIHHTLISNYVMRGPQFEANDASNGQGFDVQMESVNNVMFGYQRSGARYTTGIEDNASAASQVAFQFHFRNNLYLADPTAQERPEIRAVTKHGVSDQVQIHVSGNIGPHREDDGDSEWAVVWTGLSPDDEIEGASSDIRNQMSDDPLFSPPVPITEQTAGDAFIEVLVSSGASRLRDPVDERVIDDVKERNFTDSLYTPDDVGGFPALADGTPPADLDRDGIADDWESDHGLDPSNPADRNDDRNDDGWTNLEEYLEYAAWSDV